MLRRLYDAATPASRVVPMGWYLEWKRMCLSLVRCQTLKTQPESCGADGLVLGVDACELVTCEVLDFEYAT